MAADIFAKIGDIKGESLDDKHKDEVELLSWSWGVLQGASTGSGSAAGKVSFNDFSFTHRLDKTSPNLMKACATGAHIKEATITVRKAGKKPVDYMIFKFYDLLITSVSPNNSSDGGLILENVALRFSKVHLEYKPQNADGSLDAGVHFKYDLKTNKEG